MNKTIEKAREDLAAKPWRSFDIAYAALDYIEARDRPRWRCEGCGLTLDDRKKMTAHDCIHLGQPIDLHAEAEHKLKEVVDEASD